jgi:hypothetical protein
VSIDSKATDDDHHDRDDHSTRPPQPPASALSFDGRAVSGRGWWRTRRDLRNDLNHRNDLIPAKGVRLRKKLTLEIWNIMSQ